MHSSRVVALVPARAGSKRIVGKNLRPLGGHPLLGYTIVAGLTSGVFAEVVVSTEDPMTARVARHYGAAVPFLRPPELAGDRSADIDWVRHALASLRTAGTVVDAFAILRPTSPLRRPETIRSAVTAFLADGTADSLRAVQRVSEHPGKMWVLDPAAERMTPLLDDGGVDPPWNSTPYQALPPIYVQNASLEVAWSRTVDELGTIAGRAVRPWVSTGLDGYDLNDEHDWTLLQLMIEQGTAALPDLGAVLGNVGPLPTHDLPEP